MGHHDHPDRELHADARSIHGDNINVAPGDAEGAAAATAGTLGDMAAGTPADAPGVQTDTRLKSRTEQTQWTAAKPTSMRSKKRNQPSANS
jgi:hypothetical protein